MKKTTKKPVKKVTKKTIKFKPINVWVCVTKTGKVEDVSMRKADLWVPYDEVAVKGIVRQVK